MTKKLEETFNIASIPEEENDNEEQTPTVEESRELTEILNAELSTTDKLDAALPMVHDLNEHDREMDEIHKKALGAFDELFSLGMNVEVHAGAKLMETANQMLKTAMEAKDSKVDRKLKMINLQMQKAKLEHQIEKEERKHNKDDEIDGEGSVVLDRNELLRRIAKAKDLTQTDK